MSNGVSFGSEAFVPPTPYSVIGTCLDRVARTFAAAARRYAVGIGRREATRILETLDDRTLVDIGLTRGEIETAVRSGRPLGMLAGRTRAFDWSSHQS